jgi:hypothetical protein
MEQEFLDILNDLKIGAEEDRAELAEYASERALSLSVAVGQPGYDEALTAARDSVALKAGVMVVEDADSVDMHLLGLIAGALAFAARMLAPQD